MNFSFHIQYKMYFQENGYSSQNIHVTSYILHTKDLNWPWEERDKAAHFSSFYSKVRSDFIITACNFYSSLLYVDEKNYPKKFETKREKQLSLLLQSLPQQCLGKQGCQGALQTCCFSFEIDLMMVFTLLGTKKDKKFSTEWQTFLVVKCLTNTKRQLTCPQHVTEHTKSTRYNTLLDHVVRLSSIAVYDIYLSLTWPFTTNKRRSVLAQFTYRFFSGLFQVTASQRASSRKKVLLGKGT